MPYPSDSKVGFLSMSYATKEMANDQLRFALSVLRGEIVISQPKGRIQIALLIRDRLKDWGFWWQVRILEFHLHRFQGNQRKARIDDSETSRNRADTPVVGESTETEKKASVVGLRRIHR